MAAISYYEPYFVGVANFPAPVVQTYVPVAGAAFRRGDFLKQVTAGTVYSSAPNGSIAAVAGPAASAVTFGTSASAGKPAATYYIQVAYSNVGGTIESLPSQEFVVNVAAGFLPTVTVASAGQPAGAAYFKTFMSLFPGYEAEQSTHGTPTATGSAFTGVNPMTNSIGVSRCATNDSANIVGLAINSSAAIFFSGTGGSVNAGEQALFGATNSLSPLEPNEVFMAPVVKPGNGAQFEMSLLQAYFPALQGSTAGLTLDATSGFFIVDNSQSNKILTIVGPSDGVPTVNGVVGDTGKRIKVTFNSGTI